jgi:outer membrane murein-binding lipoprotein Lpp
VVVTPAKVVLQNATSTASNLASNTGASLADAFKSFSTNLPNIVDIGLGLGTTMWLYYLLKVPWNLYLSARRIRIEGEESIEQGIQPEAGNMDKIRKLELSLFAGVVAAHVFSAFGVWGMAWLTDERFIKKSTALVFVGAAFVRPALEYKRHISARIETLRNRIHYPTNHVKIMLSKIDELTRKVQDLEADNKRNKEYLSELQDKILPEIRNTQSTQAKAQERETKSIRDKLTQDVDAIRNQASADRNSVNTKFNEISKKFESTIIELSNDKKILEGIRGFLEIVKESFWQPPGNTSRISNN